MKRNRDTARVTRISYGAGMPVDRLKVALARLVALGLLVRIPRDGFAVYALTSRGQEFLNTYWRMRGFTEMFDSPEELFG